MNSLEQLYRTSPEWAEITQKTRKALSITAAPPKPSGTPAKAGYYVEVRLLDGNRVSVNEQPNRARLPSCCVERHINDDSTFCLHLDSTEPVASTEAALAWWKSLADYLNHQDYASKYRKWPLRGQLSHGNAANIQLRMEALAKPLGWEDELLTSMFRRKGWLAGILPRKAKNGTGLINARSPCPRGCLQKHYPFRKRACQVNSCVAGCSRQHKPILRAKCPHRLTVEQLVLLEYDRRAIESALIDQLRRDKVKCCGTMDGCPFTEK